MLASKGWTTLFDSRGLDRASVDPLGNRSTMVRDAAGQQVAAVDPLSHRTTNVFDAAGRSVATVNSLGHRVTQVFDAAGNRVALVDGRGNRYTFGYDAASREVVQIDPLSRRTTAAYDAASQRVLRIDARGYRTTFVWDNGGRMTGRCYPDGSRVTMAFDAVGNRTKVHDSTGRYTTVWDSLNRERSVKNPAGKTITYSYDAAERRRLMIEPEGGRFTYGYFDDGLARFVENPQNQRTTWSYDAAGQTLVQRLANGTRASYAYDDSGRMLRLANLKSDGTTLSSFRDTWDAGNRTSRIEADGVRVTWSYDATYQLTRERRGGANSYDVTYTYDASSNRRIKLEDGIRTTYTCDVANQLVTFQDNTGVTTVTWDANGNQRTEQVPGEGTATSVWDFENRLTQVHFASGARSTSVYDSDDHRVQLTNSSGTTKQLWDGEKLLTESDAGDVVQATYTMSAGHYGDLVSQRRSGVTSYVLFDPLGSADRLTDSLANVTDSYLYRAFGSLLASSEKTQNPFTYIGRQGYYRSPSDARLYYVRRRHYHSLLGRWLSADPLRFTDGANIYVYVENRSPYAIDPTGLLTIEQVKAPGQPQRLSPDSECGSKYGRIFWDFILDNKAPCDGYIVQQVSVQCYVDLCKSCPVEIPPITDTYWEAWKVESKGPNPRMWSERSAPKGKSPQAAYTDGAGGPVCCMENSCGIMIQTGEVRFYCEKQADAQANPGFPGARPGHTGDISGFGKQPRDKTWTSTAPQIYYNQGQHGGFYCSVTPGSLTSTGIKPRFWSLDPVEGTAHRWFKAFWCCCPNQRERFCHVDASPKTWSTTV